MYENMKIYNYDNMKIYIYTNMEIYQIYMQKNTIVKNVKVFLKSKHILIKKVTFNRNIKKEPNKPEKKKYIKANIYTYIYIYIYIYIPFVLLLFTICSSIMQYRVLNHLKRKSDI